MADRNPLSYTGRVRGSATKLGDVQFDSTDFSVTDGDVSLSGTSVAETYTTDSGTVTPASSAITVAGGEGIDTSGSGATLTIAGEDASTSNKGIASFASAEFDASSGAISLKDEGIRQDFFDYNYVNCKCRWPVVGSLKNGGAAAGATGDENILDMGEGVIMEQHILGAGQTIIVPQLTATGLNFALDLTDNEGMELCGGILARNALAFTSQTDDPFIEVTVTLADASGVDPFYVGFRKQEAYQAAIGSYTDYFVLGVEGTANPNKIQFQTNLNAGGAATTDSTDTWADAASKTIRVNVSAAGIATGLIDGVAPTTEPAAFTFDSGDVLTPFIYFLHGTTSPGAVNVTSIKIGLQS